MSWYRSLCDESLLPHTRVHALRGFDVPGCKVFVKREDETGFAMAGGKKRKYASLLPFLKKEGFTKVGVEGSEASNNVAGLCQVLIENGIEPILFLKKAHNILTSGNALLTHLLVDIDSISWTNLEGYTEESRENAVGLFMIPEGAYCQPALPGALTLLDDIQSNEWQSGRDYDHIFIDSGTGMSAAALILANAIVKRNTKIHVLVCAGNVGYFHTQVAKISTWLSDFGHPFPINFTAHDYNPQKLNYSCFQPTSARSFGSVNQEVLSEIRRTAREEGILLDPVYSAKLFYEARRILSQGKIKGNVLLIHSGGATSLFGYGEELLRDGR